MINEDSRLKALRRYEILDTAPETTFDEIAHLAAEICGAPIGLVSMLDESRAWFKSAVGIQIQQTDRCISFCDHAIRESKLLIIPDTHKDPRFADNPLVVGDFKVRFYAGAPLITPDQQMIGALCVVSMEPKELNDFQMRSLERLSRVIVQLLETRLLVRSQNRSGEILKLLNSVAVAANESVNGNESIGRCIEEICRFFGAPVGHYYSVDAERPDDLIDSKIWFLEEAEKYQAFKAKTEGIQYRRGVGLPGKVLATREASSITLEKPDPNFPRAEEGFKVGLNSAFLFPVRIKNEVVGVFEFFLQGEFTASENLLRIMEHVSTQMGRVIERSRSEAAQEKQKEYLDAILENLSDGIVACDPAGNLTIFNKAMQTFHGLELEGLPTPEAHSAFYKLCKADGITLMSEDEIPLSRVVRGEVIKDYEMVIVTTRGERRRVLVSGRPMISKAGRKMGGVLAIHDITERALANAKVAAANRTMQTLINTSPAGILVMNNDLKLTMWNPACERIYGWKQAEVLGGPLPFVPIDQRLNARKMIQAVIDSRQVVEVEGERMRKDGKTINVRIGVVPIYDENQEITGFMGVVLDISDLKHREAALVEANRALQAATEAKSDFLANMSHEIRTPLNGVIGMSDLVLETNLDEEQRSFMQVIQTSAENLLNIVNDILDFSKVEAGKLEIENVNFDLEQTIGDAFRTVEQAAKTKGLELTRIMSGSTSNLFLGDPGRIRQVLLNLLSNSIKFTSKGEITTKLSITEVAGHKVQLRVDVKDSGIGIAPEALSRLFQAFSQADSSTTRKYGGTGLGLSISKNLVELMGGRIGVESEVGQGANFWFILPLEKCLAASVAVATPVVIPVLETRAPQPFKILLAEDNPTNQMIAKKMLANMGLSADAVTTGKAVLQALQSNNYDLILMDCNMPEMDGYEASKQIRAQTSANSRVPIIAMTANAMKGDREKCLAAGMDDYLSKPIKIADLEAALSRSLGIATRVA